MMRYLFGFLVQLKCDMCGDESNEDATLPSVAFCSFLFAICTWPLNDILSTHTRIIQWYTKGNRGPAYWMSLYVANHSIHHPICSTGSWLDTRCETQ